MSTERPFKKLVDVIGRFVIETDAYIHGESTHFTSIADTEEYFNGDGTERETYISREVATYRSAEEAEKGHRKIVSKVEKTGTFKDW